MRRILSLAMLLLSIGPATALEPAFEAILRPPASRPLSSNDACRDGIVRHRIERWEEARWYPPGERTFGSVEEIMRDVRPEAVMRLEERGCEPHFLWRFLACTDVNGPPPGGRGAPDAAGPRTAEALAKMMRHCLGQLERAVIPASR